MANVRGGNKDLVNQLGQRAESVEKVAPHRAPANPIKALLDSPAVKKRFEQVLDKRAPQYMSSIVNLVNSDTNLQRCDPMSIIGSCMVAATLDLPIDKNLGYAWVIPYGARAQFQLGAKGYVQLALRSGQYRFINVIEVYEGELVNFNRLTEEFVFDQSTRTSDFVIGYAAYFELLNGFKKTVYWTRDEIIAHRDRFSKGAKRSGSVWETDFDAMASKTVLKALLSKWGILSIEMQQAVLNDEHEVTVNKDGDMQADVIDLTPTDNAEVYDFQTAANETSAALEREMPEVREEPADAQSTDDDGLPADEEFPF